MINILFPIGSYYPAQLGGPGNTIYWLAKALYQRHHTVFVGTTNTGVHDKSIRLNKWQAMDSGNVLYQHTYFLYLPITLFIKLTRILPKIDVVHLTNVFYPLSWMMACWMVLTRNKAKILWSVRGEFNEAALTYSHRRKKVAIFLVRKFLKKSVTFHSTSDHETKCIYQKLGTDVKIVQLPNFMLMPSKEEVMTTKTILYLGRIHPIKAIDQLIIAFSKIDDRNSFRLVIAGSGSAQYTQELKALCRERGVEKDVDFIGHVQGDEKQKCLASAHVLILPSQSENFGNVVVEALAQGTPVIASVNTPWEILDQVMPGSWVPNDPKSLQKAIQKYIEFTPEEYTETRRKAYTLCKERFSIENNIGRWEETYAQILQD